MEGTNQEPSNVNEQKGKHQKKTYYDDKRDHKRGRRNDNRDN